jgi:hypothetical protein
VAGGEGLHAPLEQHGNVQPANVDFGWVANVVSENPKAATPAQVSVSTVLYLPCHPLKMHHSPLLRRSGGIGGTSNLYDRVLTLAEVVVLTAIRPVRQKV